MSLMPFACKWPLLLFSVLFVPSAVASDGTRTTAPENRDHALAGQYSLTGDPGKKSRLQLHADGRFDLSMSGKGNSWQESGSWRRKGDRVILAFAVEPEPLFGRGSARPWDEDAEKRMRDAEHDAEVSAVLRRCPFVGEVAERTPPTTPVGERMAPDEALEALNEAIGELETAAEAYVLLNEGVDPPDATLAATLSAADAHACVAMMEFRGRHEDAGDAYREAGRDTSSLPEPVLPATCRMPADVPREAPASGQWLGGYGVIVGDPAIGMVFNKVMVRFQFNDGVDVEAFTDRTGWAGVRPRGVPLRALAVGWCDATHLCQSFLLAIRDEGHQVFGVRMRHESLLPPLQLELSVDGGALVPQWEGIDGFQTGRYRRD